ncbi:MAG: extracellular solute-binding protein [Clostridia bacterium]|nr:extracellular solute-binding protein [Clostridia bacterium]
MNRNRTAKRILALLSACVLLSGCMGGGTSPHGAVDTLLTAAAGERFLPIQPDLTGGSDRSGGSGGWSMSPGGGAGIDEETGCLLVAAQAADRAEGEGGEISVFAFSLSGEVSPRIKLPAEPGMFLGASAFAGNSLWYILDGDGGSLLRRVDLTSGTLEIEAELAGLPEMPAAFRVERMAADGDGDLWLASGKSVIVYTADLNFVSLVQLNGPVSSLAVDPDGRVWASAAYGNAGERGAVRLNKETGGYDEEITLDNTNRNIAFSSEGTLYYDTENGVRCLLTDEKGSRTVKPVMSFLASGVIWQEGGSLESGEGVNERSELMLAVPGEGGGLLFRSVKPEKNRLLCLPVLYVPAGEEEAAQTVTLQLAFAHEPGTLKQKIVRFNAEHPDIQITTLDYSIYSESYDAGAEKLLLDMTTGIVSPDIVVGGTESLEMMTLARKKMTVDLMPYLEADGEIDTDDIFGMILRYYDNGDGGLWGFSPSFMTETWISSREVLGSYGSDEGWSLSEYLDFAETMPEGRCLSQLYGYRGVNSMYLPGAYESFVDLESGTCSFDSPLFLRFLSYLGNLPTAKELLPYKPEADTLDDLYRLGFYALADERNLYGMSGERTFGTPDYVIVGYPSDSAAGRVRIFAQTAVIPNSAAHPAKSWEFLRFLFLERESEGGITSSFKSDYDADMDELRSRVCLHFADGGWTTWRCTPEEYEQEADTIKELFDVMEPGKPYQAEPPDEEQIARVRLWLDTAGGRAIDLLPPEVNELIREEISAFLAGVGSAEDCAAKIQSRVSIWLAEHG